MTMKTALITGVTGQDGSYLAELLLDKGYNVYGLQRRSSNPNTERIDHLYDNPLFPHFVTVYGDLADGPNLNNLLTQIEPSEIYNLGAQSHVKVSFDVPEYTANVTGVGALRLLEAIRQLKMPVRYYQASSSEMFGNSSTSALNESSQFSPQSPYGISKVFAYHITKMYRESYGIFATNGILFNHESPRRGMTFVTRKITIGLSRIRLGLQDVLKLGNIYSKRDWGYAKDYVEGIWMMMQQPAPDDFILATGETHTAKEFLETAARCLKIPLVWKGKGVHERGVNKKTGKTIVKIDPHYFRPSEVHYLLGDASKAKKVLGWKPTVSFEELVGIMVRHDFDLAKQQVKYGRKTSVYYVPLS